MLFQPANEAHSGLFIEKVRLLLSEESSAFVGHRYSVLSVDIQLLFRRPQLLFKLVDVGHLHLVHERQPLLSKKKRMAAG